ncbi:MAG: replication initiation protein [Treponema sp.]|nr:replication initiation protein [Treponema sp.]
MRKEALTDSLGQIEHQTVHTWQGEVIDHDEIRADVVDENGLAVISEDETKLKEFIKDAISVDNIVETFNDNAHETLLKLLALQDNVHPLKKGGVGIAYRTDALIMHCKMEFSSYENIVFDAILGMMSTFPENKSYRIEPTSFLKFSKYADEKYLYAVFRKGTKELKERHLVFNGLGPDGQDDISVPWFNILRYHNGKGNTKDTSAFIEFVPTDFFKDLALCSQIVHGAFGSLEVTTQLQGKYAIAFYWFLENKKGYREYRGATPGLFRISLEDLKHQFSIPESYTTSDIKRRVLEPVKKSINSIEECDFTFDYEPQKVRGEAAGYLFKVTAKQYIKGTAQAAIEEKTDKVLFDQIKMFLEASYLSFTEDEILRISSQAQRHGKDAMYMMQVILSFKQRLDDSTLDPIEDKVGYLCKMIEVGSKKVSPKRTKNFSNFEQNDFSYDDIESKIIDN